MLKRFFEGVRPLYVDLGQLFGYVQRLLQGRLGGAAGAEIGERQSLMKTVRAEEQIAVGLDERRLLQGVHGEAQASLGHHRLRVWIHHRRTVVTGQTLCRRTRYEAAHQQRNS